MKNSRSAMQVCLLFLGLFLVSVGFASATTVTLTGNILFSSLDGSAQDNDGLADGVFTVNGDLILDGTVNCNDDPPLSVNDGACPIRISVSGDLTMRAGSGLFAENRRGGGAGGNIQLTVGHDLILRGPSGALPGAVVSSSQLTSSAGPAGSITASVNGNASLEAGSTLVASVPNDAAGTIGITSGGTVTVAGLIASGPSRQVLGTKLSGQILDGGGGNQGGGAILIRSNSSVGPGIRVENGGIVVSQGAGSGAQLVEFDACGLEIRGLVASIQKDDAPSQVVLRSGKGLLIDGRDLGASGTRAGRVRADSLNGEAAEASVELFADGDVQVLGPATSSLPSVSSSPGDHPHSASGAITAISLSGSLTASGFAFEAGESRPGDQGGLIDLQSKGNATLDGATLSAVGGYTSSASGRKGGHIAVRSYQGAVSWTFGAGDVRPVGSGVPASVQGAISLTACSGINVNGTQFPTIGSPVLPFPSEGDGVCSSVAPTLPSGEPPLPVCNRPPIANAQTVTTDEDTPVTITLTGSDPDGNPLTFSIVTPPAHGSLGPLTSLMATSVQVVYTPAPDYNGPDSFTFQVDDGNGGISTATVTLSVNPVNDAPKVNAATFTLNEHSPNGTAVGTITFTDPDTGQGHTFAITSGNTVGAFAINPTTGQITVANSAALDFGTTPTFSLTVQVTDDGTPALSGAGTITINLVDVNDPPVVNPATFSVPENSANGTNVGTVTFSDPDASQTHTFAITGGNTGGAFAINPTTGQITVANGAALDFETTPVFTLSVQVTDNGTPPLSGTATITINLLNVNEAPVVNPAAFAVDENSPIGTAVGTVTFSDPDSGDAHTFAITAGNTGGAFAINPSTGVITVAGVIDFETVPGYSLTVQVADNGSPALSGTATIIIAVNNLNEPPVAGTDTYTALGNTQLRVAGAMGSGLLGTTSAINPLANDSDPDNVPAFNALTLTPGTGPTTKGGEYSLDADGSFTYTPPVGVVSANASDFDTFTYTLSDGTNTVTGTVRILIQNRVWYVRDRVDSLNLAGGDGRSTDAFETLAAAEAASQTGDIIFVFRGDTGTTPLSGGITLKNGQKLWGEGIGLTVPGFGTLVAAGSKPRIDNTGGDAVSVPATAGNLQNVEIRGLDLQASGNAIKVNSTGSNLVGITISNNALTATDNGLDARTAAGSNALTIDFSKNTVSSGAVGVLIDGSAGGTIAITGFKDNAVTQNSTGTGIAITSARFDGTPGGSYQEVLGGTTVVGASGDGVGGSGIVLSNVAGDLAFDNLDVFADGGAALRIGGTGAVNIGAGTGTRVTVGAEVAILEANGGPAVDVSNATINLQPASIKSTNSPTTGVALDTVTGTFAAGSGSAITNATGTSFNVNAGSATISYDGTINNSTGRSVSVTSKTSGSTTFNGAITATGGTGIFLNANIGSTISFTKQMVLSTGTSDAFTATGGGTVIATDTTSTLTTTTGVALNVANTTIGSGGLRFASVTAGTAASGPSSGIVLNNTGSSGSLTVNGGTIQKTTSHGISLASTLSPSFNAVTIKNTVGSGVKGTGVKNFSFTNGTIDTTGTTAGDSNLAFNGNSAGTENNLSGTVTITGNTLNNSFYHGVDILNYNGTIVDANLSSNTLTSSTVAASSQGSGIRLIAFGSATTGANITKATIANNVINNFPTGDGVQVQGGNASAGGPGTTLGTPSTANVIAITGNRVAGQNSANKLGGNGIIVSLRGSGQGNFDISNNGTVASPITNVAGIGIATSVFGPMNVTVNVNNNVVVANNTFGSQGILAGIDNHFGLTDAGTLTATITNNNVSGTDGNGIYALARNSSAMLKAKIQNNTVAASLGGVRPGIRIDSGSASGNTTVCLNISGNTSAGSGGSQGLGLRKQGTAPATNTFGVNGMVATSSPGVESYVDGLNSAGGGTLLLSATSGFTNCSLP